jgi:hypothetical protein
MDTETNKWSDDIEDLCEHIRKNSIILERVHKKNYFYYKGTLKYFRIPSIILNGLNSVLAVSMSAYVVQNTASLTNCVISLFIAIISSMEAFFQIQQNMENELMISKDYYILAIDIFKTLNLTRELRAVGGITFLDETMAKYQKLMEKSNLYERKIHDQLTPIETTLLKSKPLTPRRSLIKMEQNQLSSDKGTLFEMIDTSEDSSENNDDKV